MPAGSRIVTNLTRIAHPRIIHTGPHVMKRSTHGAILILCPKGWLRKLSSSQAVEFEERASALRPKPSDSGCKLKKNTSFISGFPGKAPAPLQLRTVSFPPDTAGVVAAFPLPEAEIPPAPRPLIRRIRTTPRARRSCRPRGTIPRSSLSHPVPSEVR